MTVEERSMAKSETTERESILNESEGDGEERRALRLLLGGRAVRRGRLRRLALAHVLRERDEDDDDEADDDGEGGGEERRRLRLLIGGRMLRRRRLRRLVLAHLLRERDEDDDDEAD